MKKKMRMFACAAAAALAIVPFLSGCAADDDNQYGTANQEGTSTEQQQSGSAEQIVPEVVEYGQVMAVNGDQVTVALGKMEHPEDGENRSFAMGEDEIVFDRTGIEITDESGAMLDPTTLIADDVVIMKGTGEGADFKPAVVEIVKLPFDTVEQTG